MNDSRSQEHAHSHSHSDSPEHEHEHEHDHVHDVKAVTRNRLWIALGINAVFLVVEVVGGLLTNSLALLADAGHMLTDVAALALAIFVSSLAERPPTPRRTYGLLRAEVLGALVNGAGLVLIVGMILLEAWKRIGETPDIHAGGMLAVAVLGLAANAVSAMVLFGSRNENVNTKGAYLHMMADTLGSLGAIVAGIVILVTGWMTVDVIASVVIGILILIGSWELISETLNILLEATPRGIDYHEVHDALMDIEHVREVHDLHIWTIASGVPSLSAHVRLAPECSDSLHWHECLEHAQRMIRERFGIVHSTLQFEPEDYIRDQRTI